jgi:activator of HSP90 ATPase
MIKQTVHFHAAPSIVYDALMDEKKHSEFIGASAKIENRVGGSFSVWDGYAEGKNIKLIPGKEIIQSWRANDWPKDVTSTVTFNFEADGKGTKLTFTHEDVPAGFQDDVKQGWEDYYWKPLAEYLAKQT